jgi:hypothetical protein
MARAKDWVFNSTQQDVEISLKTLPGGASACARVCTIYTISIYLTVLFREEEKSRFQ